MKVRLEKRFLKKLRKLDRKAQIRLLAKLRMLEEKKKVDIIKLEGYKNIYRLRVGDYRIKLAIEGDEAIAFDIERRKRAYC